MVQTAARAALDLKASLSITIDAESRVNEFRELLDNQIYADEVSELQENLRSSGVLAELRDEFDQAIALARSVLETHPAVTVEIADFPAPVGPARALTFALYDRALLAAVSGQWGEASRGCKESIASEPTARAYILLGQAHSIGGRTAEAADALERAIELAAEAGDDDLAIEARKLLSRATSPNAKPGRSQDGGSRLALLRDAGAAAVAPPFGWQVALAVVALIVLVAFAAIGGVYHVTGRIFLAIANLLSGGSDQADSEGWLDGPDGRTYIKSSSSEGSGAGFALSMLSFAFLAMGLPFIWIAKPFLWVSDRGMRWIIEYRTVSVAVG